MKHSSLFQKIQLSHLNIEQKIGNSFLQIKPGTLCIFDEDTPSNSRHYHHCFELCIVTDGLGYFWHGEEQYEVKKGMCLSPVSYTHLAARSDEHSRQL